jgi:hypothetical protein
MTGYPEPFNPTEDRLVEACGEFIEPGAARAPDER